MIIARLFRPAPLLAVFLFMALLLSIPPTAHAAPLLALTARSPSPDAAGVATNEVAIDFPREATFHLALAEQEIASALLTYDVVRRECADVSSQVPVEPMGSEASWTWVMSRSGNPPPGTELWWTWTVTDSAGNTFTTPRQSITLQDDRFQWQVVETEDIRLHWYEGQEVGPLLIDAATSGLERLEGEMGITLQDDVSFFIYDDSAAMREAVLYVQEWAGGLAFTDYNTILIGIPPALAEGWGRETVRHELAHLVIGQFGWSCLGGSRPTWLEEGLAVYAEGPPDPEMREELASAIANNRFEPLRSLAGAFPAHDAEAGLAYSQSYSVVAYLLETYGQEEMQVLLMTLADGVSYDEALESVYGFNTDALEVQWRAAIGAPPRTIPPTPTPIRAAAVPTAPPLDAPQSFPTPVAAAAPTAPDSLCTFSLVPLLMLGLVAVRRSRRASEEAPE